MTRFKGLEQLFLHTVGSASRQAVELAKIKSSTVYIRFVKSLRDIMLNLVGICACLLLAASAVIILHVAVLLYAPWELSVRLWITGVALFIYFSISLFFFSLLYSERKWLRVFKGDEIIFDALKDRLS